MDLGDDPDKWAGILHQQKQVLQKAKERQGERPQDIEPRYLQLLRFSMSKVPTSARKHDDEHLFHSSFIPPAYPPSITSIDELKPIKISELKLETHHRGTCLIVRVITPPNRMTAILAIVEDLSQHVMLLQIYQQDDEQTRKATDILNSGHILLIKEPFFKVTATGGYALRVDHLSDLVYLDRHDDRVPSAWLPRVAELEDSADALKMKGNVLMGEAKYWQAITEYSAALKLSKTTEERQTILRNRALANLRVKRYDAALTDTGYPTFGKAPSEKALFRAAEALYNLCRYKECCEVLIDLTEQYQENKQALLVLARARRRCVEASTGSYDFKLLQAEARKLQIPHLDHATYIGAVEIRKSKGKGRGLFLTKAVRAGDLLLAEKAIGHAHVNRDGESNASTTLLLNPETGVGFLGGQADLLRILVQKLYNNPSQALAFTQLHHGKYKTTNVKSVDGKVVLDTFLIERIVALNVFGCPESSLKHFRNLGEDTKDTKAGSCGIWIHASYINHSCFANARRSFIGDMMIVRATSDMDAGTEILFPYRQMHGSQTNNDNMKELKKWDFVCQCSLCEDARNTPASTLAERKKLHELLKRAASSAQISDISLKKMENLLKSLEKTYKHSAIQVPRLGLWDPQMMLVRIYLHGRNATDKGLQSVRKTFEHLGFILAGVDGTRTEFKVVKWGYVIDYLVELFLHLSFALESLGAWAKATQAQQYAKIAFRIVVGEDASFDRNFIKF